MQVIVQSILEATDEDVLGPVIELAHQVMEFFGVLHHHSVALPQGLDVVPALQSAKGSSNCR